MARTQQGGRDLKTWLLRAAQLALTVAITWFIVAQVGLGLDDLRNVDWSRWTPSSGLLVAASALLLAAYFLSAGIWGRIVVDLGGPRLPLGDAVRVFMVANLGRYVPGKVWQVASLAALARGKGVPAATAAGAAVLGQGIALMAASAIGVLAVLTGPDAYRPWGVALAVLLGLGVVLAAVPAVSRTAIVLWFRLARAEAPPGVDRLHGMRWLALYLLNWVLYALAFWVLTLSFGLSAPLLPAGSAFAAAYVIGYAVVFAPAGLGPREGLLIAFLTPHFGSAGSSLIAVVARLWTTAVEVVPAGVFWAQHVARRPRQEVTPHE